MRIPLRRRLIYTGLAALLLLGLCELLSLGAFALAFGERFSWSTVRRWREAAGAPGGEAAATGLREIQRQVAELHPYAGYMPTTLSRNEQVLLCNADEFYDASASHFRDDPDTVHVGIAGGSLAFLFACESSAELTERLLTDARFAGKNVRYLCFAFGGYKQPQQLLLLGYFLALGVKFDYLLNLDGFNEVALVVDTVDRGVFPTYPRAWIEVQAQRATRLTLPLLGRLEYFRHRRTELADRAADSPWRWSITCSLLWKWRDQQWEAAIRANEAALQDFKPPLDLFSSVGPTTRFESEQQLFEHLADVWSDASWSMHSLCEARGIPYLHFLQPNQYYRPSKELSEEELRTAFRANHPYRRGVERGYPELRAHGRTLVERGVDFHDLTQVYAETRDTIYRDDCCHVNALGNQILAEAMARAILGAAR